MAAREFSRRILNILYASLSVDRQAWVHGRFSKIFRGYDGTFAEGKWRLTFCGRPLWIPLRRKFAWLDWDTSVSVLGNDAEIKQTYATLIQLERPPRLVLDIGANRGTHSILFLIHGIATVPFEPNPVCHPFFQLICEMNGVQFRIEPLALGSSEGVVDLWYPEGDEWNGTTDASVKDQLGASLTKIAVTQTTVDCYVRAHRLSPDVLKIDTEGTELQVLQGAAGTLTACRPIILFESFQTSDRAALFSFLDQHSYVVSQLPLLESTPPRLLSAEQFRDDRKVNFAGLPRETIQSWPPGFGGSRGPAPK
jgi:FkbM family methyltransferase